MRKRLLAFLISLVSITSAYAAPHYGITYAHSLIGTVPEHLEGYRVGAWFQPSSWQWQRLHVYVDASFGHWWVNGATYNHSLNTFALAPVLRYYFLEPSYFT